MADIGRIASTGIAMCPMQFGLKYNF